MLEELHPEVEGFSQMADDFVFNIILLKKRDFTNSSIPFLYAHALELSSKAALIKLGCELIHKHNVREMLDRLSEMIEGLNDLLPSDKSYNSYRELWLSDKGAGNYELSKVPHESEVLDEWELCYFIENVVDLKYGLRKDQSIVSVLKVARPTLNQHFKRIFRLLRSQYSSIDETSKAVDKGLKVFGKTDANKKVIEDIFWPRSA